MALELLGYELAIAYAGPEGVRAARDVRLEVVLCDIGLPGLDGYEVARRARGRPELAGAKLVALTAYSDADHQRLAREAMFLLVWSCPDPVIDCTVDLLSARDEGVP